MSRKNASRIRRHNNEVKRRREQHDYGRLFNGNIYNQWEFIFIWGLILIMIFILGIFIYNDSRQLWECFVIKKEYTLESAEVVYNDSGKRDLEIVLDSEKYTAYGWCTNIDSFLENVSVGDTVTARTERDNLVGLAFGGEEYIDPEKIDENRTELAHLIVIPAAMMAVWGIYVAFSWYVMYNADKYPRLVRLFVKPEYIRKKRRN